MIHLFFLQLSPLPLQHHHLLLIVVINACSSFPARDLNGQAENNKAVKAPALCLHGLNTVLLIFLLRSVFGPSLLSNTLPSRVMAPLTCCRTQNLEEEEVGGGCLVGGSHSFSSTLNPQVSKLNVFIRRPETSVICLRE